MSKDFPTLEENIQFIIKDLGVEKILAAMQTQEIAQTIDAKQLAQVAQAIPVEQEYALLRTLLLKHFSPEEVESILKNDGKLKS